MAIPKNIEECVQKLNGRYFIYFRRKDDPKDHQGFFAEDLETISNLESKDFFSRFNNPPSSWDELENMPLNIEDKDK